MAALWTVGAWQSNFFGIWSAVGGTAVLLAIAALVLEGGELRTAAGFAAGERSWNVVLGIGAGLAMSVATYLVFPPVVGLFPGLRGGVTQLYEAFGTLPSSVVLVALPLVVACEEIVWRGIVYGGLTVRLSPAAAVVAGTLVYALAHVPIGSVVLVLACVGAGFCWNALRAATGSLVTVFLAHLVWDFLLLVSWPLVDVS